MATAVDDELPLSAGQKWLLGVYRRRGATWLVGVTTALSVLLSTGMATLSFVLRHTPSAEWPSGISVAFVVPLVVAPLASTNALRLLGAVAEAYDRLTVLANTDVLTGLSNRRRFFIEAERRADQLTGDQGLVVAMIDLNSFKEVNDGLGHAAGDAALVAVARRIAEAAGPDALACRLGGDEFGCLVPESSGGVEEVGHRLSTACDHIAVVDAPGAPDLVVSASVGVARLAAGTGIDAALAHADEALYQVKDRRRRTRTASTRRREQP